MPGAAAGVLGDGEQSMFVGDAARIFCDAGEKVEPSGDDRWEVNVFRCIRWETDPFEGMK